MVTYYYKSLRSQKVQELKEYKPGAWVYAEAPTDAELDSLIKKFDLTPGHLQDALDENEMPRLESEGDQTYIFVRFGYRHTDGELETVPLLLINSKDVLVTVSLVRLPFMDVFLNGKVEFATTQRTKLILQILQQIVGGYEGLITKTSKKIKQIRSRLRGHEVTNQDSVDFVLIEDELNEILSNLMPANATLRRLLLGRSMPLYEEDQDIVEDLLLNNEQSVEACNSNIKSIINIREAYSSISSNNLNRTMKRLTVVTVMVVLPSMFFGMYGMNVALPLQEQPWAFAAVTIFSFAFTLLVFAIARSRRYF